MKTEIIVIKPYPFCPVKVGEKLELSKNNCYCVLKTTLSDIYMEFGGIKQDAILMQFLEIKEGKSIEDYVKETYNRIRTTTDLLRCYPLNQIREKHIMEFNLLTQRFFNSELLRTIADDLNEGWQPEDVDEKYKIAYVNNKYVASASYSNNVIELGVVYLKNKIVAQQAIELMGEERLNTLR